MLCVCVWTTIYSIVEISNFWSGASLCACARVCFFFFSLRNTRLTIVWNGVKHDIASQIKNVSDKTESTLQSRAEPIANQPTAKRCINLYHKHVHSDGCANLESAVNHQSRKCDTTNNRQDVLFKTRLVAQFLIYDDIIFSLSLSLRLACTCTHTRYVNLFGWLVDELASG